MRRALMALTLVLVAAPAVRADQVDAKRAFEAFLNASFDARSGSFAKTTDGKGTADFWWQAHFLETALDASEATGDERARAVVDELYDGFTESHPGFNLTDGSPNDYNDDLGWWALALGRAYQVTGETRFRDRAVSLFQSIAAFEDPTAGGGVWWTRDGEHAQKNMATNAPFVMTAVELYQITGDPAYLAKAKSVYAWAKSHLVAADGTVSDRIEGGKLLGPDLTYDYGTFVGAGNALYLATGDRSYLDDATRSADKVMSKGAILPDEAGNDGQGFKMILTRYLARLAQSSSPAERARITSFLDANAQAAWDSRNDHGLTDHDWTRRAADTIPTFAAASGVDAELAPLLARRPGATVVNLPLGGDEPTEPTLTPTTPGVTFETASQATLHGLSTETLHEDVPGAAHVAGWEHDGQWMDFHVSVPADGRYTVAVRYAAGAGDASRYVYVNGHGAKDALAFRDTKSWDTASETSLTLDLHAGDNTISLIYDSSRGSSRPLNVDRISVAQAPGGSAQEGPREGILQKLEGLLFGD